MFEITSRILNPPNLNLGQLSLSLHKNADVGSYKFNTYSGETSALSGYSPVSY